jgi:hypothetical protein
VGAAAARRLALEGFRITNLSSSENGEALGEELGGTGATGSNPSSEDVTCEADLLARLREVSTTPDSKSARVEQATERHS